MKSIFSHEKYPFLLVANALCEEHRLEFILSEITSLGYQLVDQKWMVGGSQEISIYWFIRGKDELILQEETYEGYKVFGQANLLADIQHLAIKE